jgi:hypothetical protein
MLNCVRNLSKTIGNVRASGAGVAEKRPGTKVTKASSASTCSMEARMKTAVIAATFAVGLSLAVGGIANAQSPWSGTQLRMAQADEDVSVTKKETPYGTKKVVKKKVGEGLGVRCKKVSVTKSNDVGDSEKKTATRCG